mgnify:CR=1 FL=1
MAAACGEGDRDGIERAFGQDRDGVAAELAAGEELIALAVNGGDMRFAPPRGRIKFDPTSNRAGGERVGVGANSFSVF